jgi:hypothetical protein
MNERVDGMSPSAVPAPGSGGTPSADGRFGLTIAVEFGPIAGVFHALPTRSAGRPFR